MASKPRLKNCGKGLGQHRHTGLGGAKPFSVPIWIRPGCRFRSGNGMAAGKQCGGVDKISV